MDENDFLLKVFQTFPPENPKDTTAIMANYKEALFGRKYVFERAFQELMETYRLRKLPSFAILNDILKKYKIREDYTTPPYVDIEATINNRKYVFASKKHEVEASIKSLEAQGFKDIKVL